MGYRALQQKANAKRKRWKTVTLCILLFFLVGLAAFSYFVPPASWKYYVALPKTGKRKAGELRIHFLDVGQGDSTLIELPDGKVLLIDGGDSGSKSEKRVLRHLNALKIQTVDYLFVTHTDRDHCGALSEVFRYKKVLNAYLPTTFDTDKTDYAKVYDLALKEGCEIIAASPSVDLSNRAGNYPYTLRVLYPFEQEHMGGGAIVEEDPSTVLWLDYLGTSALFTGDISSDVEDRLLGWDSLDLLPADVALSSTEILKVAHHGSAYSSGLGFLRHLGAQAAVISCGKDNDYGHPTEETLERLTIAGADIYRTDTLGSILLTADETGRYDIRAIS